MPKAKTRKRRTASNGTKGGRAEAFSPSVSVTPAADPKRVYQRGRVPSVQNLVTAAFVALGCWGFAFTFAFLTNDPNRYLFGGLAALLALMWTINFAVRFRQWRQKS